MTNSDTPITDDEMAHETAKILIETQSILFNTDAPFTYTSGRVGPVYIDCRRLISFPKARSTVMDYAATKITNQCGIANIDIVAGGETAGIPYAAFISERLNLPMAYIRKKAKGFGRTAQIEGHVEEGQNLILIEDLQNYGTSQKIFIDAIRKAGANINNAFVLFNYGNDDAKKNMAAMNVKLHALCTWKDALKTAKAMNYFDTKTLESVSIFLEDPIAWSVANGGKDEEEKAG